MLLAVPAAALARPVTVDLPAGSVAASLQLFAQQSGLQILFPYDAAAARAVPRIRGTFDDRRLLARLARSAGLVALPASGNTVVLQRAPPPVPPRPTRAASRRAVPIPAVAPPPTIVAATALSTEDIIVTAEKRSEVVARVPAAIGVVPGRDLKTLGVQGAFDLQNIVPGLGVNIVQHGINLVIRGVTTTDITSKGEQGIAFNLDGIFVGRPIEQALALFDIDRIEVLRGPQGTLYGKSSTGGAVNVITNKPQDRWGGYARLEIGNFMTRRAEAALNAPVADWLAVRAAGSVNRRAGFLVPTDGSARKSSEANASGRLSALARPSPDLSIRLTLTGGHVGGSGAGYANLGTFTTAGSSAARRAVLPNPYPAGLDHHFLNVDGQVDARVAGMALTYLGARRSFAGDERTSNNNDPNGSANPFAPNDLRVQIYGRYLTHIRSDVHEVRLANPASGRIDYVIGANFHHERIAEDDHNLSAPLGDRDPARSFNNNDIIGTTTHRSYGLFGQATWHFAPRLALVGGLRFSRDGVRRRATAAFGLYDAAGNACYGTGDCIGNPASGQATAAKLTYRAGINFTPAADQLVYGSIATGYKAGGFNDAASPSAMTTRYAPEQLVGYELGYKGRVSPRLRVEASAFYYDYARTQIAGLIYVNGAGVLNTRVVPTRLFGLEAQATWAAGPLTSLLLSTAFEKSDYLRFRAGYLQDVDWSHRSLDRTPTFAGTATLNQAWPLAGGQILRLRLFTKVSTPYYLSDFTSGVRFRQRAFTRSDASLTLAGRDDRWSLQAFVQNVENGLQAVSAPQNYDPAFLNAAYLNISDPRLYGLRLGFAL